MFRFSEFLVWISLFLNLDFTNLLFFCLDFTDFLFDFTGFVKNNNFCFMFGVFGFFGFLLALLMFLKNLFIYSNFFF
jgi:hypothetical protein